MRALFAPVAASLLLPATLHSAAAQSPQFVPAYPLYCQGPLTTGAPSGGETTTPFKWASVGPAPPTRRLDSASGLTGARGAVKFSPATGM